ncbi:UDP-N-acetylmuramoyl-L-alanine--D-glutamate ligase [Flavilitoribacter nigricans]|uniref:UDP-N-acetylmuramoylalanine--D-glutamate ligase n=1 Tax=Flavilitoribacter nigricans (strain ATCC 23147 / DSM 23189 / NBRC 102662 / NCIMB 1420 / SS-2) TaxID=1122177 RepID=A0A2D0NBS7_FLAN2|nr:UDP-N-acetylmuramoyl-L-alanine--D-glutamate ligase [Flavilitoribacter nigricans]PHN05223.1 UDP-N-acetylmuramoyl-L-alanine--D-glutamate ligase [Flavilitoribacter nigricans DSM 23189 = NBRC 102662]
MRVVILGSGESGVGAAILAQKQEFTVFVSDRGNIQEKYKAELESRGIPYEEGRHTEEKILSADEVVKSPGIPDTVPLVQQLLRQGTPVISEIEFAARYSRGTFIGITGSNGKTTTSTLSWHLLKGGGLDVTLAGNVGRSFAWQVAEADTPYYVLELSSFQLDGIRAFRPKVAMLLNITPDHLDRYDYKFENYIRSKFRIGLNQEPSDHFLYNGDDPNIGQYLEELAGPAQRIAIDREQIEGSLLKIDNHQYDLAPTALRGRHNAMNALFAIRLARLFGIDPEVIQAGLESFEAVEHRLERVAIIDGVEYINDSKATNVDAVFYALEAMERPVIWVVGGQDKGNDYEPLLPLVRDKVKGIVCMGVDNSKIIAAFGALDKPTVETGSASEAVQAAAEMSGEGDIVLLSPACASFDLFKNYVERGRLFKQAVLELQ